MRFTVQIRDKDGRLLTEWLIPQDDTAEHVDVAREIAWLREVTNGVPNAEHVAESVA